METVLRAIIWVGVSAGTLLVPLLMVSLHLPRRPGFIWRLAASTAALAAFQLLFVADGPLSTIDEIPVQVLVSGIFFFSANSLIMGIIVLLCYRTSLSVATFCAVVGYTVENLAAAIGNAAGLVLDQLAPSPVSGIAAYAFMALRMLVSAVIVYSVFYLRFVGKIRAYGIDISPGRGAYLFLVSVILFNVVFDIVSKRFLSLGMPLGYVLISRAAVIAMCLYTLLLEYEMLFNRHMQAEIAMTARLMEDWKEQYELSRNTIEAINVKCHDIRHQIRHLEDGGKGPQVIDREVLADIAREINVYDSTVETGNDALDTILTEKSLIGGREGISLNCIADGEALSFMSPAEIYSFFGNAIENAFEAVEKMDDPSKRAVSLVVKRIAGMVSIHVENRYDGTVGLVDGVPQTSKGDSGNHGFGFKSMRLIVERYGGTLTADIEGQTFLLNALIPIPEA